MAMLDKIKKSRIGISAGKVMTIFIAMILAGATLPTAFSQIFNASTTNWTSATINVWQLIPLFAVIGIILGLVVMKAKG